MLSDNILLQGSSKTEAFLVSGMQSTATIMHHAQEDLDDSLDKIMAVDDAQSTGTAMVPISDMQSETTFMGKGVDT